MGGSDIRRTGGGPVAVPSDADVELFHDLYRAHFDFVFRNLRRLGVPPAMVDDAVQEVFVVVLRHLGKYTRGTSPRAWLFAIAVRVARNRRRSMARRGTPASLSEDEYQAATASPFDELARLEARRILHEFLDALDEDRRSVFVMAELEQMTAPEIAAALDVNLNTVYGRLRSARRDLARLVSTLHARAEAEHG